VELSRKAAHGIAGQRVKRLYKGAWRVARLSALMGYETQGIDPQCKEPHAKATHGNYQQGIGTRPAS